MISDNKLYWIAENILVDEFPDISHALSEPDGLLAMGGILNPERLLQAYRQGIFPWYSEGQPVLWWSPDPRCVLFLDELKISKSLKKSLCKNKYSITFDQAFSNVVKSCAEPRLSSPKTWITQAIIKNYQLLHESGHAHSVECWHEENLVGGLYGVAIGKIFFGESMFSHMTDTSKICLANLVYFLKTQGYTLIDCQVTSEHLQRLGASVIPRNIFSKILSRDCKIPCGKTGHESPWPVHFEYVI